MFGFLGQESLQQSIANALQANARHIEQYAENVARTAVDRSPFDQGSDQGRAIFNKEYAEAKNRETENIKQAAIDAARASKPLQVLDRPGGSGLFVGNVFDPYGRVSGGAPGQVPGARPSPLTEGGPIVTQIREPGFRPSRGPDYTPGQLAPQAAEMQAFQAMIRCLSPAQLNALAQQLAQQRSALESQPPGTQRNLQISTLKMKQSHVSIQKRSPKPCQDGGLQIVGGAPISVEPGRVTPLGPAMPDRPSVYAPEVSLHADTLDLYQRAALAEMQREEERVTAETEELVRRMELLQAPTLETQPETFMQQEIGAGPQMPTMGAPMSLPGAEEAAVTEVAGPVSMSAEAVAETEKEAKGPNWLLIAGVAALGLLSLRKKPGTKKKKA